MKLEVNNLKKSFGEVEILHGISFSLESGKALGLLGRNGAGKTTTIRILMDVFKANEGSVLLDGKTFEPKNFQIGYMPEERGMYPKKKVMDQLIYFAELRGLSKVQAKENGKRLLEKLAITEYETRKLETLSKGNQQKVQLAQTLICDPEIIILDEPFSGLDPVNSQLLKDLIQEEIQRGKLVIFSSHQMSYVEEFCEDIVILDKGSVALSGDLKDIQAKFGDKKAILSANGCSNLELAKVCENSLNDVLKVDEVRKEFVVFEMKKTKSEVMTQIVNTNIDVAKFGDYIPSLTDIFVKVTGDKDETVY